MPRAALISGIASRCHPLAARFTQQNMIFKVFKFVKHSLCLGNAAHKRARSSAPAAVAVAAANKRRRITRNAAATKIGFSAAGPNGVAVSSICEIVRLRSEKRMRAAFSPCRIRVTGRPHKWQPSLSTNSAARARDPTAAARTTAAYHRRLANRGGGDGDGELACG